MGVLKLGPRERLSPMSVMRIIAGLVMAIGLVVAGPAGGGARQAAAAAAPKLTGVDYEVTYSAFDSRSPKHSVATCPAGKVVLGGGSDILPGGPDAPAPHVTLTQMEPYRTGNGRYEYSVRASETAPGTSKDWILSAYAICADPVSGYEIKNSVTPMSSASVQATAATCSTGKRVLGTGARINFPIFIDPDGHPYDDPHGIGLQVQRADALGVLTRAQAHERPSGYSLNWQLLAFAVCGTEPQGYVVKYAESEDRLSETFKIAGLWCPGDRNVLNSGGAISNIAPGNATLYALPPAPSQDGKRLIGAVAAAYENTPTSANWDFIVAQAICADK
jgi:hypothetical protein